MKRTNELSRTAKPCPLERRVRYAGQAPAPIRRRSAPGYAGCPPCQGLHLGGKR